VNRVIDAGTFAEDSKIFPNIRQELFHWGFELNDENLRSHIDGLQDKKEQKNKNSKNKKNGK